MKHIRVVDVMVLFAVAAAVAADATDSAQDPGTLIIGSWACQSGGCPDEEISFSIEDGIRLYDSWLHERPSASGGTWKIDEGRLTIECCAGLIYEYEVVRITDTELVLGDAETSAEVVMSRIE